jgi:hypothetical protein
MSTPHASERLVVRLDQLELVIDLAPFRGRLGCGGGGHLRPWHSTCLP